MNKTENPFPLFGNGFFIMKITNSNEYIRQQEPGQFRRAGDGKKPFTYVNDQRVKNLKDRKKSSVYIANKNVQTLEKGIGRYFPKLFEI